MSQRGSVEQRTGSQSGSSDNSINHEHTSDGGSSADGETQDVEDELMYDKQADTEDAEWVKSQYPGTTDAILSCPLCFTQICFTCQHHVKYPGQFRALSVEHCEVDQGEWRQADEDAWEEDLYHPVKCAECGTKVGVIDSQKMYHLFGVLTDS
ncbi:hypothetical protein GQ54DRAFT_283497 [Martensiomyces pterosporus]|nr:hypothetical protein GQ54DRAFT_283497 [Martensiomyces pterosporus]